MSKKPQATKKRVTRSKEVDVDFAFFHHLRSFYQDNRKLVRTHFKDLSKKFIDFNDPEQPGSFLRLPQFEALEMYVFLKEFCGNKHVQDLFEEWYEREGAFANRKAGASYQGQMSLIDDLTEAQYRAVISKMKRNRRIYPNYIFALTMGTGKTILMATCIFYEFILANKWPKDKRFCHNALVFAPDRTVLNSLREIQTFDLAKVVPPEYVSFLTSHIRFHFLEDAGTTLSVLGGSKFNVIISNTQKIILKKQHREKTAVETLFSAGKMVHKQESAYDRFSHLYLDEQPADETELISNQRFEALKRVGQLGIYVDEAHHAFGDALAKDMGVREASTSLRVTIDELSTSLKNAGSEVVACFNYTGTPYVGREILPEVVYAYGLREAIEAGYLKRVRINGYENVKSGEFVKIVIDEFVENFSKKRFEGMLPKLAFFASTIEELQKELKPAVSKALAKHGISEDRILVNVGDDKLTTSDDIREFNRLDTPQSNKQFILLVNKGKEGWNCRSLFGVALYREPKSKIFVLQATMRCLRSIGDGQPTGHVFLSAENEEILENELQANFRISTSDLQETGKKKESYQIKPLPPPVKIKLRRVRKTYEIKEKKIRNGIDFGLDKIDVEKYRMRKTQQDLLDVESGNAAPAQVVDITHYREKREFTDLTLVAEVSRYLNKGPILIEEVLENSKEGLAAIVKSVNAFNEVLYDHIIPKLFAEMYDLTPKESSEEHEVELVKQPPEDPGYYQVRAEPEMVVEASHKDAQEFRQKSFHLSAYAFDSNPEKTLFWDLLRDKRVKGIWFTGMLTHGQSDFAIQYIDPETHAVRSYYPDFVLLDENGQYIIVEVKGDNMVDDPTVQAKTEYAEALATSSKMTYRLIKGSEAMARQYQKVLN